MRLHLVDGTYELFRAHFSRRPAHQAPDGTALKATVGLVSSMLALLSDPAERPTHLAVAFDNPIRSFRNDLFDGYKTEEGVPEELLSQFDLAELATRALGIVVWSMSEFEADDALATGAARFAPEVEQVRILTPDKDLGQCVRGDRIVQVDRMRAKLIDEPALRALRGIGPESIPDWLALVGDSADGYPGLRGFGRRAPPRCSPPSRSWKRFPPTRGPGRTRSLARHPGADTRRAPRGSAALPDPGHPAHRCPVDASLSALEHRGIPREPFQLFAHQVDAPGLLSRVTRWAA
jgi:hypothetical protein